MPIPRLQDVLFAVLSLTIAVLLALGLKVGVFALLGSFACGAIYLIIGMVPARNEQFGRRVFTSVFLAVVLSCLVLIVPTTLGARSDTLKEASLIVAVLLPAGAFGVELLRTPRLGEIVRRSLWGLWGRGP